MRMRQWVVIAATLLASTWSLASPPTPAVVDELMHKSGLWQQLAQVGLLFVQGVDKAAAQQRAPDQLAAAMRQAYTVAFGPDRLRPVVARELAAVISAEEIESALAWLTTDLGIRITKLEEDQAAADAVEDRSDIGAALAAGLSPERLQLYERLSRAMRSGEVGATMMINLTYALARGMSVAMPGAPNTDPEEIRAMLDATRPRLVAMMEQRVLASMALGYATLSNADLERYVAFAESPAGGRYNAAATIALDKALSNSAREVGRLLATGRSV